MSIAFFDVDGTLLPLPSLERRLFWELLRRGKIPAGNYFRWVAEMARLDSGAPAGAAANKMYLRGVCSSALSEVAGEQRHAWLPEFFPAAIQRVWWHALRGDTIALVTGTLAPLAEIVKGELERELIWRGVETEVAVIATRLETRGWRWTGRVDGPPMLRAAKASAAREFAAARKTPLARCSAYGDGATDRWLLASVGSAFAVNPSARLRRIAQRKGWSVLYWKTGKAWALNVRQLLRGMRWKGQAVR